MKSQYERDYCSLVTRIIEQGELRKTRNVDTIAIFGETLTIDPAKHPQNYIPLLQGRKIHYAGILGELAAMLKGPKHLKDFKEYGCNFWNKWGKEDGSINIDYGNVWNDFNGVNQLDNLRDSLLGDPYSRRMVVTGWKPDNIPDLDLPCCHLLYQWYVRKEQYLDMIWYQRSVDTMIGLPSNVLFAYIWNIMIAYNVGLVPGRVKMILGDTHIYKAHLKNVNTYIDQSDTCPNVVPEYSLQCLPSQPFEDFIPSDIAIHNYHYQAPIPFELFE